MKSFKKRFLPLVLLGLLAFQGCSRLEIAYDLADGFIVSALDDYFDLTSEQKQQTKQWVKRDLKVLLRDHSMAYIRYQEDWILILRNPDVKLSDVSAFSEKGQKLFVKVLPDFETSIREFLLLLKKEQFDHLKRKATEDLLSMKDEKTLNKKRVMRWLDWYFFEPSDDQQKRIDEFLAKNAYPFELEKKMRIKWVDELINEPKEPYRLNVWVHRLTHDPFSFRDPQFKLAIDQYLKEFQAFQVDLLKSLSPIQRIKMERLLRDRLEQIEKLKSKKV